MTMRVLAGFLLGVDAAKSGVQMEAGAESLTDYDRATVGLDELMGDLSGQMTELRGFPSSVFFHEAVMQGLGQHIDAVNPWTKNSEPKPKPVDVQERPYIGRDMLTLHNEPAPPAAAVNPVVANTTEENPPATLRTANSTTETVSAEATPEPIKFSFTLPGWMAVVIRNEHPWLFRGVAMMTFVCAFVAYVVHKNKMALKQ